MTLLKVSVAALVACGVMVSIGAEAKGRHTSAIHISNTSDFVQSDALIDIPVQAPAKAWSVQVGKTLLPAQYMPETQTVRFVVSLKAHESIAVSLLPLASPPSPKRVQVTLNVQEGGVLKGDATNGGAISGGRWHLHDSYTIPKDHFIHDGLLGFEGIGWESDRVAYRLYLDPRNVVDLFGKFNTDMIYRKIGLGFDDYQYPRVWGGDIFKVGASLGVGGVGLLREGKATQIGPATITGHMLADGPVTAIAGVDADAIAGGAGYIHATYSISAGSPMTWVKVHAQQVALPLVTGLTVHPGDQTLLSEGGGGWSYIAVWGAQEHGPDKVGTVVFYRSADISGAAVIDGQTLFVPFKSPTEATYAFAGRWVQENKDVPDYKPIRDLDGFKLWLERTRRELDQPPVIVTRQGQ